MLMTEGLPPWNEKGFLPPNLPPTWRSSPYVVSPLKLVQHFGFTPHRRRLLAGFFALRAELRRAGFRRGFQWLGGSFVDAIERVEGRPPGDIDTVSFLYTPEGLDANCGLAEHLSRHAGLFDRKAMKACFHCDAFILPLDAGVLSYTPEALMARVVHWLQLFGNFRATREVKGILQVDFEAEEEAALAELARLEG